MTDFFIDDGQRIGVEKLESGVRFLVREVADIFPAVHYVEQHPEARNTRIEIQQVPQDIIDIKRGVIEKFTPE
jgi:hypothetical protein